MDAFLSHYCAHCAQLQFPCRVGKPCEFCGYTTIANLRPKPIVTALDRRILRSLNISPATATKELKG